MCFEDVICQNRVVSGSISCSSGALNQMAPYSFGTVKASRKQADSRGIWSWGISEKVSQAQDVEKVKEILYRDSLKTKLSKSSMLKLKYVL